MKKNVFIIAEVSANHGQSLDTAVRLIKKARECGADAVKFQAYTPDTMTLDVNNKYFMIKHPKWGGRTLYQLYKEAYTPWRWFHKLKKTAEDAGLVFFATAFDKKSVDFLEELKVPFHKIASFELVDLPLIEYAARTKKPIILSAGMATISEISDAVSAAKKGGARSVTVLKCVSGYPARAEDMNLSTISDMIERFKVPVGLSDHTLGNDVAIAAVSLGASVVEKHFTLSRKMKTADAFFSIEPEGLKSLVSSIRTAEKALGKVRYGLTKSEEDSRIFRRSIFAAKDITKGSVLTENNKDSEARAWYRAQIYQKGPGEEDESRFKKRNAAYVAGNSMKQTNANVCIIDYGSGNINSVYNIFKSFHDAVKVSNSAEDLEKATHLVLPGVGAFKAAMDKIRNIPTFDLLKESVLNKKKWFLGICVGMQVLADEGNEHCFCKGLGWIPGSVNRLDAAGLSLPHVGWNNIKIAKQEALLDGIGSDVDFYYVHSYHFEPKNKEDVVASSDYGTEFTSIVKRDNIYGVQFHPEKSQRAGVKLLKNFLSL